MAFSSFTKCAKQVLLQCMDEDSGCDGHSSPSTAAESDHWSSGVVLVIGRIDGTLSASRDTFSFCTLTDDHHTLLYCISHQHQLFYILCSKIILIIIWAFITIYTHCILQYTYHDCNEITLPRNRFCTTCSENAVVVRR